MIKKDENLSKAKAYLESHFKGQSITLGEQDHLLTDRPEAFFYTFQVENRYFLAVVRAMVEEETVFPVLEGESIAEKMTQNAGAWVVIEKAATGKGNRVTIHPH